MRILPAIFFIAVTVFGLSLFDRKNLPHFAHSGTHGKRLEHCAWKTLENHVSLLDIPPISRGEFLQRQATLAGALDDAGVDAFIAESIAKITLDSGRKVS